MGNNDDSPALRLMKIIWGCGDSKALFHGPLQQVLLAAIEGGLRFAVGDFTYIFDEMKGYRWFVKRGHLYGEWLYAAACRSGNASAWKSFEAWRGRIPFIVDGKRLYVGAGFRWRSKDVRVTSFSKDQSHLVACSYRHVRCKAGSTYYATVEVEKIYKITRADIYAWNKERKGAAK